MIQPILFGLTRSQGRRKKVGKYTAVASKLPPLQPDDKPYQDKVEEVKSEISKRFTSKEFLKCYCEMRKVKDEARDLLSAANLELEAVSQLLIEQFETEGIESKKLDTGESLGIHPEPYPVINDPEKFRVWCLEQGLEQSMKLPWQSTAAIVKERLLGGEPEPPGVSTFANNKIIFRKARS